MAQPADGVWRLYPAASGAGLRSGWRGEDLGGAAASAPRIPSPRPPMARPRDVGPASERPAVARRVAPVLSERDVALLRHLADGMSVAQIATAMAVTTNTTRTRIRRIQRKLSVVGRSGMVREARALGAL